MAIYDLTVSVGSRAGGHSASAKDEYIEREGRYEEDRSELEHSESGHMPEWAEEDAHAYWEAADAYERANGRLYREVEFALPNEHPAGDRPGSGEGVSRCGEIAGAKCPDREAPVGCPGRGPGLGDGRRGPGRFRGRGGTAADPWAVISEGGVLAA